MLIHKHYKAHNDVCKLSKTFFYYSFTHNRTLKPICTRGWADICSDHTLLKTTLGCSDVSVSCPTCGTSALTTQPGSDLGLCNREQSHYASRKKNFSKTGSHRGFFCRPWWHWTQASISLRCVSNILTPLNKFFTQKTEVRVHWVKLQLKSYLML